MERVPKERVSHDLESSGHLAQGIFARYGAQIDIASRIDNSPRQVAQCGKLQNMFGCAAQLQGGEIQRLEEEEPLQARFAGGTGPVPGRYSLSCAVIQAITTTKDTSNEMKDSLALTRSNLNRYSYAYLTSNVAYSMDHTDLEAESSKSAHSEREVYEKELLKSNKPREISIATERPPCLTGEQGEGCSNFFTRMEKETDFTFSFSHIINDGEGQAALYTIYRDVNRDPRIPEKR